MIYQFSNREAALRAAEQLKRQGYNCIIYEEQPRGTKFRPSGIWAVSAVREGQLHPIEVSSQAARRMRRLRKENKEDGEGDIGGEDALL